MKKSKNSIFLTMVMGMVALTAVGCKKGDSSSLLDDVVNREDFTSVYSKIGKAVTIEQVFERDGVAFVELDGQEYELGMDFLSMAMVYNVAPMGEFNTEEAVYNEWWRLHAYRG